MFVYQIQIEKEYYFANVISNNNGKEDCTNEWTTKKEPTIHGVNIFMAYHPVSLYNENNKLICAGNFFRKTYKKQKKKMKKHNKNFIYEQVINCPTPDKQKWELC